jgi:hypothetical protein
MDDVSEWHINYGSQLAGVFFDNGPLDNGSLTAAQDTAFNSYYAALRTKMTQTYPSWKVMLNASQYPKDWVMGVADFVVLYERPLHGSAMVSCPPTFTADEQNYIGTTCSSTNCPDKFCPSGVTTTYCSSPQQPTANWYFAPANAAKSAHVIRAVTSSSDIDTVVTTGRLNYGAPGLIYIHDQNCDPRLGALYSQLSTYFEHVVSTLAPSLDVVIPVTNASTGNSVWVPLSL